MADGGLLAFYPQIKAAHVGSVLASGGLFTLRGLGMLAGSPLGMTAPVRYLSYAIDTALLTTALMLATALHLAPFVNSAWLTAKVLLLLAYIVLGSLALKRAATRNARAACFAAALAVYAFIISIARAHHPLGLLSGVL
jgi:uncharacterized membrane protein SirB2